MGIIYKTFRASGHAFGEQFHLKNDTASVLAVPDVMFEQV